MQILILSIIAVLFFPIFGWSTTSISLYDSSSPAAYYIDTSTKLFGEKNGGGSAFDKPLDIYIPIENAINLDYTKFKPKTNLPNIADVSDDLFFYADIENTDTGAVDMKAHIAIATSSTSHVHLAEVSLPGLPTANEISAGASHSQALVKLSMDGHLCSDSSNFDCTALASTPGTATNKIFYVFLYNKNLIPSSSFDPTTQTDYANGFYIDFNFSNVYRDNSTIGLKITNIDRGDESLYLNYSTQIFDSSMREIVVFRNDSAVGSEVEFQNASGSIISEEDEFPPAGSGTIHVRNLVNGNTYNLSLAFADKYGFLSKLTTSVLGQPQEIQEFLKSQQCYLLSAGFGRSHFVIDFFKGLRDNYLSKFYLGRELIGLYYESAPNYTEAIYTSDELSFFVRSSAYIVYYTLKYILPISLFIIFTLVLRAVFKGKLLSKGQNRSLTK